MRKILTHITAFFSQKDINEFINRYLNLSLIYNCLTMLKKLIMVFMIGVALCSKSNGVVYTQVTCLYDIKRGELRTYKRPFTEYLRNFEKLLATDSNLIIFGGQDIRDFVWQRRKERNTIFVEKEIVTFREFWFYPYIQKMRQKIKNDPSIQDKTYPQFTLQYYNAIMMSKLYLMVEASKLDKWNTDIMIWTDGGYMHIFPKGESIVSPQNVVKKFGQLLQPQWFYITYEHGSGLFVGYKNKELPYIHRKTHFTQHVLAGFQGGYVQVIRDIKCAFENLLRITLQNGDMDSDQPITTFMHIRYPFLIPNKCKIFMNQLIRNLQTQQDISRVPYYARFWEGKIDSEGNLEVLEKNNSIMYELSSKSIKNETNTNTFLQIQKQNALNRQLSLFLDDRMSNLKLILQKGIDSHQKYVAKKIVAIVILSLLYLLIFFENKRLKKTINNGKQEQSERKIQSDLNIFN